MKTRLMNITFTRFILSKSNHHFLANYLTKSRLKPQFKLISMSAKCQCKK